MSSEESDAYVHAPEGSGETDVDDAAEGESAASNDARGTVLLVAVVLATLVIPGIIYLYPALLADRVPFLVAMLVLPFVPAVLLGLVAVWSMKE